MQRLGGEGIDHTAPRQPTGGARGTAGPAGPDPVPAPAVVTEDSTDAATADPPVVASADLQRTGSIKDKGLVKEKELKVVKER